MRLIRVETTVVCLDMELFLVYLFCIFTSFLHDFEILFSSQISEQIYQTQILKGCLFF